MKKTVTVTDPDAETSTSTVITYCMAGDLLVSETRTTGNVSITLWYQYDSSGMAVAVRYSGNRYVYLRNLQNDVIGLLDSEGTLVVRYEYDSWGKVLKVEGSLKDTIGALNPFRYRGYYYDVETELYYLKSRYYDPGIRRFISSDDISTVVASMETLNDRNIYSYCDENPIDRKDSDGELWGVIGALAGAVISVGKQRIVDGRNFSEINWIDVSMNAISFAAATTALGRGAQMVINAATSCVSSWSEGNNVGVIIGDTLLGGMSAWKGGSGAAFGDEFRSLWNFKFRINRINYSGKALKAVNRKAILNFSFKTVKESGKIGLDYVLSNTASSFISKVDSIVTESTPQVPPLRQIGWGRRNNPKTGIRETYAIYA